MNEATQLWERWQALLGPFATLFTRPGWVRFVPWVTGMVLGWEEPTSTQILTALGLEARGRVLEHVAEDGAWDRDAVERQTLRLIAQERPARWGRYPPVALAETTLHRTRAKVWGTCTVHEASARSPNRAEVAGTPWRSLPHAARLYGRKHQVPAGEHLRTTTTLAVEWLRQADAESAAPILGVVDGAYAGETVVDPCLHPQAGQRQIESLTRWRVEARLYQAARPKPRAKGRRPRWGPRLAAPQHHLSGSTAWQKSRAWV